MRVKRPVRGKRTQTRTIWLPLSVAVSGKMRLVQSRPDSSQWIIGSIRARGSQPSGKPNGLHNLAHYAQIRSISARDARLCLVAKRLKIV